MKTIKNLVYAFIAMVITGNVHAQFPNTKTTQLRISGNCEMCKSTIEKSGSRKGEAKVEWDKKSKIATITYDSLKQTSNDILKRIALAGYDNEKFLAPDAAYSKLPDCCKYERSLKRDRANTTAKYQKQVGQENPITSSFGKLFLAYFELKNALIQSDGKTAINKASDLAREIKSFDMSALSEKQHNTWMSIYKQLYEVSIAISETNELDEQRKKFSEFSKDFYELAKVAQLGYDVYYQHCPMFNSGANWLSRESDIKNPFYGSQMLSCGKNIETIK